jgi:hypothetical protein
MAFHGPSYYANQLLAETVDMLAIGPGDVRSRLLDAYAVFHPLTTNHFPDHLRTEFEWVMKQLTKRKPYLDSDGQIIKGSVQVSIESMRNSTGVKIARKLLELHYALEDYIRTRGQ